MVERMNRTFLWGGLWYLPVLALAWGLKAFYRQADAEQLNWILAPTATLVNQFRSSDFQYLKGVGWTEPMGDFVIAPACAGVNFLILLLVLTVVLHLHRFPRATDRGLWLLLTPVLAYGGTILVNTVRILLSIPLYEAGIYGGWLTPERAHRLMGIILYLSALWLLLSLVDFIVQRWLIHREREGDLPDRLKRLRPWLVVGTYLGLTLGVPWLNGAHQRFGPQLVEHSLTVLVLSLTPLIGWWAVFHRKHRKL